MFGIISHKKKLSSFIKMFNGSVSDLLEFISDLARFNEVQSLNPKVPERLTKTSSKD